MTYKRILVIDDDDTLAEVLKIRLQMQGYEVMVATNGKDGMRQVRQERPDLVILDITLPDVDGFYLCELLKNNPETQDIPVIMLTGRDMGHDFDMAMEKKADWYIVKPFDDAHLTKTIENLFRQIDRKKENK
ncbi:MAG: response regulator [Elusimicrobia bacterium]|nr:response regulator [Elusimicrobiota bacterium]